MRRCFLDEGEVREYFCPSTVYNLVLKIIFKFLSKY